MLLIFRPFRIGQDIEVGGKAGKVRSLSLFMTELVTPDNVQILLPNGSVWGQVIINRSSYPGTGEVKVAFPVPAGAPADAIAERILKELRRDPRIDGRTQPAVHVSRVIDIANADRPVVELTVTANVKPSDTDAVKQEALDRIGRLVAQVADRPDRKDPVARPQA
jgi:small conductance mechanosensitive channel